MRTLQRNAFKAELFQRMSRWVLELSAGLNGLMPPAVRLMNLSSAFWQSRTLYVAARLDLANHLGDDEVSLDDLAARCGAHASALKRLLRMLTGMGVFSELTPNRYRNNKLSNSLRSGHAEHKSVRALILFHNSPEMSKPWFEYLEAGVRSGEVPFKLANGQELFDYMDQDPAFDAVFAAGMDDVEAIAGHSFVTEFDWRRFHRLIDVGGSKGAKTLSILREHPKLRAIVVDRAESIRPAPAFWEAHASIEERERVSFTDGDARLSVPMAEGPGDVYLLSAVLHGPDDSTCINVLKTLALAIGTSGASTVIAELILPDEGADLAAASFDMQMFIGTRGRERTLVEWQELFAAAKLQLVEVIELASFAKLMVLRV